MKSDRPNFDPARISRKRKSRFQPFQNLMLFRIRNILLVSSLYDLFLFEEDGRIYELLREEYQMLNLSHAPDITRVSSGKTAIEQAKTERRFDLIITTLHVEDMAAHEFAAEVRESGLDIPVVLLAYDNRELADLQLYEDTSVFDRVFVWQGDFRIIIAIIKLIEDTLNVDHDTRMLGVQTIMLIEDSVRYYSSFLPHIYFDVFKQSTRLITEGVNLPDRFLRMRARPKILLFNYYEEAWEFFRNYKDYICGVISDIDFKRNGKADPRAGIRLAKAVKKEQFDIPILLQSKSEENREKASEIGASFVVKNSPTLLRELRQFMLEHFGWGDFVFRLPDGTEVARAQDLKTLEEQLHVVSDDSLHFHSARNHFSNWLKARTEFELAEKLRPVRISDYASIEKFRRSLIAAVREYRLRRQVGIITEFTKGSFYPHTSFSRMGGGSLGGKARGLSFINRLVHDYRLDSKFKGVKVYIPPSIVVGTDVFDEFLDSNNLRNLALSSRDDDEITRRFIEAPYFPPDIVNDLRDFLDVIRIPIAVRSSSLLEDSQYQPFAGVYRTYMLPNNHLQPEVRLRELLTAIKCVYASTFHQGAKEYIRMTSYRLEEEKMAIIIQKIVGCQHEKRFYPDFAGVAKSYNFYPVPPQKPEEGIASVALGLGKTVVDGGASVKFSPRYPKHLPQFSSTDETLRNNQRSFYALSLEEKRQSVGEDRDPGIEHCDIDDAEKDGTLTYVASTYSHDNHTVYDGISRSGHRLVTFAPILKHEVFPLPEIIDALLEVGTWGMGTPIEIEFAVKLSCSEGNLKEFALLQMRPLVVTRELEALDFKDVRKEDLICRSDQVMGNAIIDDIKDVVLVDVEKFARNRSRDVAAEISLFNTRLISENHPYLLIAVGRLGTLDPWLGIPVKWEQISGARVIVETGFEDINVQPSQGSHFFHNLTSFNIGYFTVDQRSKYDFLDWEWLRSQKTHESRSYAHHIRFKNAITVKMNGRENQGVIVKPG